MHWSEKTKIKHAFAVEKKYLRSRRRVLFAGFLLALMGGASYAWGVFIVPMTREFGWTKAEATLPFTVFMVVFALFMVPAGKIQDKIGPKKVSLIGALLFFAAYGLASFVVKFPSPWWLICTYGIIGGMACGFTYACVAPPARKWFPEKPGFAVSLAVMGFGLAALIIAPLKAKYFIPMYGIGGTFWILAIVTSVVSVVASVMIKNPPKHWLPPQQESSGKSNDDNIKIITEIAPGKMIKTGAFWLMWLMFAMVAAGGLVAIGFLPSYGEKAVGLLPVEAALAVSIFAGFNGLGRPLAGFLGDKFGIMSVMALTYFIQAVTFFAFDFFAVNISGLYVSAALLGWGYAVTLALFPSLTSLFFGVKHLGYNYGVVFTAFGVGALAPFAGSWIIDVTGNFTPAFIISGIASAIGMFLALIIKRKYLPN